MSQTALANLIYIASFAGVLTLEHFGIVPTGTAQVIYGALGGAAVASGTLTVSKGQAVTLKAAKPADTPTAPTVPTVPVTNAVQKTPSKG